LKLNDPKALSCARIGLWGLLPALFALPAYADVTLFEARCEYAGAGNFGVSEPVLPEGMVVTGRNTKELNFQCVQAARAKFPANFVNDVSGHEESLVRAVFNSHGSFLSKSVYTATCMIGDIESDGFQKFTQLSGDSSFDVWRTCHNIIESRYLGPQARRAKSWLGSIRTDLPRPPQMGGICVIARKGAAGEEPAEHPVRHVLYSPNPNDLVDECHQISEAYFGPGHIGRLSRVGPLSKKANWIAQCFFDVGSYFKKATYVHDEDMVGFDSTLEARRTCQEYGRKRFGEKKFSVDLTPEPEAP
jgi:hypothetical protein